MMVSHLADRTPPANIRSLLPFLQGSCFILIETARFAATSLLIVLGLPLALFLFVAGWDLGGLFTQLANLSDLYVVYARGEASMTDSLWLRQVGTSSNVQIVPPEPGVFARR